MKAAEAFNDLRWFRAMHHGAGMETNTRNLQFAPQWLYFPRWRKSMSNRSPIMDRQPWMTFRAIDKLKMVLHGEESVFEWGSGGSTLFFRDFTRNVVSIEHSEEFHSLLQRQIGIEAGKHQYLLIPPVLSASDAGDYRSSHEQGRSFQSYVHSIDAYQDESFDLISVDGRARNACIRQAIPKLKPHGVLILDNSERLDYTTAHATVLAHWSKFSFAGCGPYNRYFWETTFFIKPYHEAASQTPG